MTSTLDSLSYTTLELKAIACDTTWEDLTLIVEELLEELGVLVVHILDASFLKAAVLLLLYLSWEWSAIATSSCSCHDYFSATGLLFSERRFSAYAWWNLS